LCAFCYEQEARQLLDIKVETAFMRDTVRAAIPFSRLLAASPLTLMV
jgi:hypothetical protein